MYGALTVSILVFTAFLCWMLYYLVQILKQGNEVIQDVRQKITEFEQALQNIKQKVITSATSISFIASEIGTVVDIVKSIKQKKAGKNNKRK
ncbi:MAG: hypothetical protein A2233_02975 [Candidatus Kerfeldbacteria bacterium RIFOXYA2_FULL_38_24]|nr:MAG: hypothetical protein A2233_02975 [Candidatus Kerfeldbacteria bacterium RIFOXYA2_FULL_38_24]